jgi:hypothetical protein
MPNVLEHFANTAFAIPTHRLQMQNPKDKRYTTDVLLHISADLTPLKLRL